MNTRYQLIAIIFSLSAGCFIQAGKNNTEIVHFRNDTECTNKADIFISHIKMHSVPGRGDHGVRYKKDHRKKDHRKYVNSVKNQDHQKNGLNQLKELYLDENKISEIGDNIFKNEPLCIESGKIEKIVLKKNHHIKISIPEKKLSQIMQGIKGGEKYGINIYKRESKDEIVTYSLKKAEEAKKIFKEENFTDKSGKRRCADILSHFNSAQ